MAEAFIPVDLFNPGQVFASLGLLEVADSIRHGAEGGFDWTDPSKVRFVLHAPGLSSPIRAVLEFLASARITPLVPARHESLLPTEKEGVQPIASDSFPGSSPDRMALPIRLEGAGPMSLELSHWCDGSDRNPFKLYAGNRSAYSIACAMVHGTKGSRGMAQLFAEAPDGLSADPFGLLIPMGGSFNFDPRGGWTALDAGYSPNAHASHAIASSPVVEMLAAIGLQHARPDEYKTRRVRYATWAGLLPPMLARPALGGSAAVSVRRFEFTLALSGKNKVVTFANEEHAA